MDVTMRTISPLLVVVVVVFECVFQNVTVRKISYFCRTRFIWYPHIILKIERPCFIWSERSSIDLNRISKCLLSMYSQVGGKLFKLIAINVQLV